MKSFDHVVELAKRRGLFFPSGEIYAGSPKGVWEYGPIGNTIKRRIEKLWREIFVVKEGMFEISGGNLLPAKVFEASGHLKSFADPLTQCTKCNTVHRADKLIEDAIKKPVPEGAPIAELDEMLKRYKIKCPKCGGGLAKVQPFNLMFELNVGAIQGNVAYLRPETCQNIFIDFPRIFKIMRRALPFGITQIGRSYRNEISPRRGLVRMREFTQAECEVFFNPKKINSFPQLKEVKRYNLRLLPLGSKTTTNIQAGVAVEKGLIKGELIAYYMVRFQEFFEALEVELKDFRFRELSRDERPFYAAQAFDFEIKTSWGWQEVTGHHYRTDHDLKCHMQVSGKDLRILEDGEKFIPHVWEFSLGVDRLLFCLLDYAYRIKDDRTWLQIPALIAPYDVGVFPLVRKDGLPETALELEKKLRQHGFLTIYDQKGSIGRRYARVDEIGCKFVITIDYQTKEDKTVTIRERDSTSQIRLHIEKVVDTISNLTSGKIKFKELNK